MNWLVSPRRRTILALIPLLVAAVLTALPWYVGAGESLLAAIATVFTAAITASAAVYAAASLHVSVGGNDIAGPELAVMLNHANSGQPILEEAIVKSIIDVRLRAAMFRLISFVTTLVGTIGRTAVVPSSLAGANVARAVGVIPASEQVDPHWIECWFRSPLIRQRMIGKAHEVARKTLNLEDVRAAAVALPPRSEQSRILEALDDYESMGASTSDATHASSKRCSRLRRGVATNDRASFVPPRGGDFQQPLWKSSSQIQQRTLVSI